LSKNWKLQCGREHPDNLAGMTSRPVTSSSLMPNILGLGIITPTCSVMKPRPRLDGLIRPVPFMDLMPVPNGIHSFGYDVYPSVIRMINPIGVCRRKWTNPLQDSPPPPSSFPEFARKFAVEDSESLKFGNPSPSESLGSVNSKYQSWKSGQEDAVPPSTALTEAE